MRERFQELAAAKRQISINFSAAHGGKLLSISGIIAAVGDDHLLVNDIYGNSMIVPTSSIAYVEIKK